MTDRCDPRPASPGDSIVFFEGFAHGVPADWVQSGPAATAAGGAITVDATGGSATISRPGSTTGHDTVFVKLTQIAAGAAVAKIGILHAFTPGVTPEAAELCYWTNYYVGDLTMPDSPTILAPYLALRAADGTLFGEAADAGRLDVKLLGDRRDHGVWAGVTSDKLVCVQAAPPTPSFAVANQDTLDTALLDLVTGWYTNVPAAPHVGIRIENARATVEWMMVVENH